MRRWEEATEWLISCEIEHAGEGDGESGELGGECAPLIGKLERPRSCLSES